MCCLLSMKKQRRNKDNCNISTALALLFTEISISQTFRDLYDGHVVQVCHNVFCYHMQNHKIAKRTDAQITPKLHSDTFCFSGLMTMLDQHKTRETSSPSFFSGMLINSHLKSILCTYIASDIQSRGGSRGHDQSDSMFELDGGHMDCAVYCSLKISIYLWSVTCQAKRGR